MRLAASPLKHPHVHPVTHKAQPLHTQPHHPHPHHLRAVRHVPGLLPEHVHDEVATRPPPVTPLNPKLIGKLAVFAYETVEGTRSVGQLSNWVSTTVARQLTEYRSLNIERRSLYRDDRRVVPTVRRVRVVLPIPGVAEAAVVLNTADRVKAVALRFETIRGHWQATSITVL